VARPRALKEATVWSDIQNMEQPVQRDGTWWQQYGDHWYQWNPSTQQWEVGSAPPPPAPPAPAIDSAVQPSRAYAGSGKPAENDARGNTWSAVSVNTRPDAGDDWSDEQLTLKAPRKVSSSKLAGIGFAVLAVAVLFGAYTYFFSGTGVPSDDQINSAFGSLNGYEYMTPPKGLEKEIDAALEADPTLSEYIKSVDFRIVQRKNLVVGAVAVIGYEPGRHGDDAFDPRANQAFTMGINQTSGLSLPGAKLKTVTRGNTTMYELKGSGVAVVTFIDDVEGMIFSIATTDAKSARSISEQLALENL
jgi:hypothetical protein